ncbi:Transcriptional regulatory protein ZraR [Gemmata sp. SH-PL17]|uniref:response regulator n=1 Tax=Gemmata sp. SH-PL17 TaxID=1630693 RepID=UPI0004BC38BF|nr:response regulator [Gemmata sp. SH-PL17]AMV26294.1 Transcriptional regulatory protein ZraR [Gemmata sp. SH-PL17]
MTVSPDPAVLVVDDSSAVRAALGAMLVHHGYNPRPARSGAHGVEMYRAGGVVAAILDVQMPGMDGPATLDALRALDPDLPCVFVSGDTAPYTEAELLARGAIAVLGKPVDLHRLGTMLAVIAPRAIPPDGNT